MKKRTLRAKDGLFLKRLKIHSRPLAFRGKMRPRLLRIPKLPSGNGVKSLSVRFVRFVALPEISLAINPGLGRLLGNRLLGR
ncbi:MAG TPA: hypothetical protein VIW72_10375, partial [Burkholderiales bacterium]